MDFNIDIHIWYVINPFITSIHRPKHQTFGYLWPPRSIVPMLGPTCRFPWKGLACHHERFKDDLRVLRVDGSSWFFDVFQFKFFRTLYFWSRRFLPEVISEKLWRTVEVEGIDLHRSWKLTWSSCKNGSLYAGPDDLSSFGFLGSALSYHPDAAVIIPIIHPDIERWFSPCLYMFNRYRSYSKHTCNKDSPMQGQQPCPFLKGL